ncbi:MAG: hypothetical protein AB7G06_02535 [Bdellovibrionales bacterium]
MSLSFSELVACTLSGSWNKKWRTPQSPLVRGAALPALPAALRDEMAWLERVSGGVAVVYGGCFGDGMTGRTPKDYDLTIIAPHHPLVTMGKIIFAAVNAGKSFGRYLWRHSLPWKRVRLKTVAGLLDMGCIQHKGDPEELLHAIADNADFGVIAAAATLRGSYVTQRFLDEHERKVLRCRALKTVRDYRNGVYKRLPKYAGIKYAGWPLEFESAADARYFSWAVQRRYTLPGLLSNNGQSAMYDFVEQHYLPRFGMKRPRPSVTP